MCGIYIGCALFAVVLIFLFLDSYSKIGLTTQQHKLERTPIQALVNTIKHLKNKNQLLIIPLTLWSGFEQAYIGADFTKVKRFIIFFVPQCIDYDLMMSKFKKWLNYINFILIFYYK